MIVYVVETQKSKFANILFREFDDLRQVTKLNSV